MWHATTPFALAFPQVLDIVLTLDARGAVLLEHVQSVTPIQSTAVDKISTSITRMEKQSGEGGKAC